MFSARNLLMRIRLFLLIAIPVFLAFTLAHTETASVRTSSNFKISWDVFDGAGSSTSSNGFKLQDSVGQPSPIGESKSDSYKIYAGFHVPSVPLPPPKPGDVSNNGEVTAYDASLVLQHVVGLITLSLEQRKAADVTGDDTISALDAALILQYTVGLITCFPVECIPPVDDVPATPVLNPKTETELLTEAIKQLDTAHLTKEQKQILEQLKRLISQKLLPTHTMLFQNFPNPFNPETWIPFQLSDDAEVAISIYNLKGELVRTIDVGKKLAGFYANKEKAIHWDGRTQTNESAASGVYFYTIKAGDFTSTRKMILVK